MIQQTQNVAANGLTGMTNATLKYLNENSLDSAVLSVINSSLEVSNENPIAAQSIDISTDEIRVRAKNYYATQNRAVSKQDYEALVYNMPPKFGGEKRVNAISDPMATNRKLALYIVSESGDGILELSNMRIKNNIKTWLSQYKGINDQLEIFDPYIINFGIGFRSIS